VRLRVVVHNVHGFRAGVPRVAAVAGDFEPNLVLVNESGSRRRLPRFARELGMEAASDPRSVLRRRVRNAVLVHPPLRVIEQWLHRFPGSDRGALVARLGHTGRRLWAISVHLGLSGAERVRHVRELADIARGLGGPVLMGGDLNEPPDGSAAGFLGERFWDAWLLGGDAAGETYPAEDPTARIDYLFVSEGFRVERVLVPAVGDVSDHRPVVAELLH